MERRKRSRVRSRTLHSVQRRFLAFALAFAMTFTNVGANLNVAYASGSSETITFELTGSQLVDAIDEAIARGNAVTADELDFTDGKIAEYEKLFFGTGKVYEAFPEPEGGDINAELRVFVRLPEDSDDKYKVTGEEDVIFLYVNNGEETISCITNIIRIVDGEEKVKKTKRVTVKAYESVFGEAEVNVPSGSVGGELVEAPVESLDEPLENPTEAPVEESTEAQAEESTEAPAEESTEAQVEESTEAQVEESTEAQAEESTEVQVEESTEAPAEEPTEAPVENPTEAPVENPTEAPVENPTDAPVEVPVEEPAEEPAEVSVEVPAVASVIRHYAPLVAVNNGGEGEVLTSDAEEMTEEVKEETIEETIDETSAVSESGMTEISETQEEEKDALADSTIEVPAVDDEAVAEVTTADLVALGEYSTAKAYVTSLNKLGISLSEGTQGMYTLVINHVLNTENAIYAKQEVVTLDEWDFEEGFYDTADFEYVKAGMERIEAAPVLTMEDFEEWDGTLQYQLDINYRVSDGWHIVTDTAADGAAMFSIYIGDLDEVVIEPDATKLIVKVNFLNESGVPVHTPYAFEADAHGEDEDRTFSVDYTLPVIGGYTPELEDGNKDFVIEAGQLKSRSPFDTPGNITVDVIYIAGTIGYTVKHLYQALNSESYVENEEMKQELHGQIDTLTEAVEIPTEGFTSQDIIQKKIVGDGTVVEVKYDRNDYTLLYDTTGGSYVPSVTAKYESGLTLVSGQDVPTRKGYTFAGWYLDEELEQKAEARIILKEDTRLYAKWEGAEAGYKVVYLTENADDDDYSYAGTVDTLRARAGETVTANAETTKPQGFDTEHFTFKESSSEEVSADGDTVILVKYDRNTYTITFKGTSSPITIICGKDEHIHNKNSRNCYQLICSHWFPWNHNNSCYKLICSKTEHQHTKECYASGGTGEALKITAKYQANISAEWMRLVGPGTPYETNLWEWKNSKYTALQEIMPGENVEVKKYTTSGTTRYLYYYVEDPVGDITYNNKRFSEYTLITFKGMERLTYEEDFFVIDGYTRDGSNVTWSGGVANFPKDNIVKFYYARANYQLKLINGDKSESRLVPYTEDIKKYLATPTYNPLGDGTFSGWYMDPSFQELYNGDGTMPKGLILYAKWNPVTYVVTFSDPLDESVIDEQTIPRGKTVQSFIPEKPGHIFRGWYTDKECTKPFDYAEQITEARVIYAKWEVSTTTSYMVVHKTTEGTIIKQDGPYSGKVGASVIATAMKPEGEFAAYIPDAISKTHTLSHDPDENVIEFIYTSVAELSYIVQYKYRGDVIIATEPISSEANYIKVTADTGKVIPLGYKIAGDQLYQWVTLAASGNIVVFDLEAATYNIEYVLDGGSLEDGKINPDKYTPIEIPEQGILLNNPKKSGYEFWGWELVRGTSPDDDHEPMQTVIGRGSYGHLEFKAKWQKDSYGYRVEYYFDGVLDSGLTHNSEAVYGDVIDEYKEVTKDGYKFERVEGLPLKIGENELNNVIKVYYVPDEGLTKEVSYTVKHMIGADVKDTFTVEGTVQVLADTLGRDLTRESDQGYPGYVKSHVTDADGNTLADDVATIDHASVLTVHYQEREAVLISYRSEDIAKGTVTRADEKVAPVTGEPEGSKAEPQSGYKFSHWTKVAGDDDVIVGTDEWFKPLKNSVTGVYEAGTYTAHFVKQGNLGYTVEYYFDEELGEKDSEDNVGLDSEIPYTQQPRTYKNKNYIFEKTSGPKKVTAVTEDNVLKVYYVLDEIGVEIPDQPDGIPDKYQIMFTYTAGAGGTVTGRVREVYTVREFQRDPVTNEITQIGELMPAKPKAEVTVSSNSRYSFANWRSGSITYGNVAAIREAEFTETTSFVANFTWNGGGTTGGGGGGGSTITPVVISSGEIPLGSLPEEELLLLDDGEIPLAALPKTGDAVESAKLLLFLSGLIMAAYTMLARKEEE